MTEIRLPPHNFEAEQALLGAILMNNHALEKVAEFLRPEHFADLAHGRIYQVCQGLILKGQLANPVTLHPHFEGDPGLAEMGGTAYLARLAGAAATIINAAEYGRLIFDSHLRRELIAIGEDVVNDAFDAAASVTAAEIAQGLEARLFTLTERADTGGARSFDQIIPSMVSQIEAASDRGGVTGLSTGLVDLDDLIGGMAPSNLLILGARPAMGKSALGCVIAAHVARTQAPVGVFSLEMTSEEIGQRIAADSTGLAYQAIRNGRLDAAGWGAIRRAANELSALPLHIDDTQGLHIDQIRVRARRLCRRHHLGLIIIDHLHLIRGSGRDRLAELTKISADLKAMARELGIPVLALCQLNRGVEGRDDKRPMLSDLRESGSIEQDADVVLFLHRAAYYTEKEEPQQKANETRDKFTGRLADWHEKLAREKNRADVLIPKNRHGRTGVTNLYCDLALARFGNLAFAASGDRGL